MVRSRHQPDLLERQLSEAAGQTPRPSGWRLVEDLLLIAALLPLWPVWLGWSGLIWKVLPAIDAVFLVVLLALRWRRFRRALEEIRQKRDGGKGVPMPGYMPFGAEPHRRGFEKPLR